MNLVLVPREEARTAPGPTEQLPPFRTLPVTAIAAAVVSLELAVSARYGFHRDELYFLACARHLAWGYVDQPPLVPALAWLSVHVLGTSPQALRLLPAFAGGTTVVLAGLMARELGGGWRAQVLAALAAATSPVLIATFHLLSTAAFDDLIWCVVSFLVVRILRTGSERLWVLLGAVIGLGLMNKWNIGFFVVAMAVGFVVGGRTGILRSPWPWAGAGLAVALWLPDLAWNAQHQWAEVAMSQSLRAENGGLGQALGFVPSQLLVVGPVLAVFWIAGLLLLVRSRQWRPLGVAYLFLLVVFTLTSGKPYYLAGMYYVLFAAGGVWAENRLLAHTPPRGVRGWTALMVASGLISLPLALPVVPAGSLPQGSWEGNVNKDLSATVGWQGLVAQVARVEATLPASQRAHVVVFTGDYGAAGAIDLWGSHYGLPHAISGHNTYWWWGPDGARNGSTTIAVDLSRSYLKTIFSQVTAAGFVATPGGVWSEERGDPIFVCRGQIVPWDRAWPSARHYG
jgi:4-amino-4-deoxy-L-arabinose transferase-like glycosyltransferase